MPTCVHSGDFIAACALTLASAGVIGFHSPSTVAIVPLDVPCAIFSALLWRMPKVALVIEATDS